MSDSSSFTSLLALVDSHLSKVSIQESRSEDASSGSRFSVPGFSSAQAGTMSDTRLPRLPLPSFCPADSPIQTVLAEQVANMLKAKELKKQREEEEQKQKKLADELKKLKEEQDALQIIDLVKVLQEPYVPHPQDTKGLSSSSSTESLFELKFIDCDVAPEEIKTPEPLLPCIQDMSYILDQKIKRGKCSAFGKVLTSRLKPVAAPYLHTRIKSDIVPFDFSTPSPCDIVKERLRRPRPYSQSFLHSDCIGAQLLLESMMSTS